MRRLEIPLANDSGRTIGYGDRWLTHRVRNGPRARAFAGGIHNNKMERMNGEVRDREKTFRGLKSVDSPILKGYQLFHNFVRPHEALDGETPADRCGVKVEGANKWLTIIQNSVKAKPLATSNADKGERTQA